jgi:type I restriction enzyme R subunit
MVGRGTRVDEPSGKLMFRVYDYTDATRLFGHRFLTRGTPARERVKDGDGHPEPAQIHRIEEGLEVHVSGEGRYIVVHENGRAMPVTVDEYRQRVAESLTAEAPSLDAFRRVWIVPNERLSLLAHLPSGENGALALQRALEMEDCDLYDVLGDAAYGLAPRTKPARARAFEYKNKRWLNNMPPPAAATLEALADEFSRGGTEALENPYVFDTQEVRKAGGIASLEKLGRPDQVLKKTKERLFAA